MPVLVGMADLRVPMSPKPSETGGTKRKYDFITQYTAYNNTLKITYYW
jgi:hypothetical protein